MRIRVVAFSLVVLGLILCASCGGDSTTSPGNGGNAPGKRAPDKINPADPGKNNPDTPPNTPPDTPPEGLSYTQLSFQKKLPLSVQNISAIGSDGEGKNLYFGATDKNNVLFAIDLAADPLAAKEIKTCVLDNGKCAEHMAKGSDGSRYLAAYEGVPRVFDPDQTQIKSIVEGPGKKAIISLTGLVSNQYTAWPSIFNPKGSTKKANGGLLQVEGNLVKGVWGNTIESLNAGVESKEISSVARVEGTWVAFSQDPDSFASFRAFDGIPGMAQKSPIDNQNRTVSASTSSGNALFKAFSDGTVRRLANAESSLSASGSAEDSIVDNADKLKIEDEMAANDHISALAVVGDTLLVGLAATPGQATGGVALVNLTDPTFPVTKASKDQAQWNVVHIAPSKDGKSALVSTDGQGLMYFSDGRLMKINSATAGSRADAANPVEFEKAKLEAAKGEGFSLAKAKVGAVNVGNSWYIATDNAGIFEFVAKKVK